MIYFPRAIGYRTNNGTYLLFVLRGVIVRLKSQAVLESGDATLALKSCSPPPIVRERPGA